MNNRIAVLIAGAIAGIVLMIIGFLIYGGMGLVDPRADIPVSNFEAKTAMKFLDASLDRRAPDEKNPVASDEANLIPGMKLYQSNCAGCHGDINHSQCPMADSFYPRPPQFMHEAPDMPANQNFYVIKHGIRYSGMPAWEHSMDDRQIWQTAAFLGEMGKLPQTVQDAWKAQAK